MTIRNLDVTLAPASVALIGATTRAGSVGRLVTENVIAGGFAGRIYPVNPKHDEVQGLRCYHRLEQLPEPPEVAVVMTPAETVPGIVAELGACGTKAAVVLSAGLTSANGLRQQLLDAARPSLLRLIGPNTIGLIAPRARLNASFAYTPATEGQLALISQSGAIVSAILDWAATEGIGFSQVYSLGDMADVDVGDCLNVLAADAHTSAILMYLESIPAPRKFMSAARAAARIKPVIAVKPGRHAAAAKAAATHTGALAGADAVVDAALRRAGIIRVDDLRDLFDAAEITGRYAPLRRGRVAIVTNGGGAGVLAVDKLLDEGAALAELTPETMAALDVELPATWSHANPIDIIGDAPPERYRAAIATVAADPGVDALLVMNCPTALADPVAAARSVASTAERGLVAGKPTLACWLGQRAAAPAREVLQNAGIGEFATPAEAAKAVGLLTRWATLREHLQRVPPRHPEHAVDFVTAESVLGAVAREGRALLTEDEAKTIIEAYGIPVPRMIVAGNEDEVEAAAATLLASSQQVVVKLRSKRVSHKSDVGGVVLNLKTPAEAKAAASRMSQLLAALQPPIVPEAFAVEAMVVKGGAAEELIVGLTTDPQFGPVVLFGAGGTAVEVTADTATGLVPLDDVLAGDLIDRTRVSRKLAGFRDHKPADRGAIVDALRAVSQLAVDFPVIRAIDINPLLADAEGVVALDARIEIDPGLAAVPAPNPALAICPYPSGERSVIDLVDQHFALRPIRPEDAELYPHFLDRVEPADMRLRFLAPMRTLSPEMLVRLTQLDYDRDMALIALEQPSGDLAGIVRYSADPDRLAAEFGILVRSDLQGRGLGRAMLVKLIDYARREGIGELFGRVLRENVTMLTLCAGLGFEQAATDDPTLVRVRLHLGRHREGSPADPMDERPGR